MQRTPGPVPQPRYVPGPPSAPASAAATMTDHCVVCAQPSTDMICDPCKAAITGEAISRIFGRRSG